MAKAVKILIIDDSPDDEILYRRALAKGSGVTYEFAVAKDGESGLAQIGGFDPDCILLDYSLPGHNGLDVLKQLRADHPFVPVAMLTGQGNEAIAVAAMREGAQNYIAKSTITPEAIQHAVGVAIDHCDMQKHIHEQRICLESEITERRTAERDAKARMERLHLLHQITRAIGERQDLDSIFQVVVSSLEEQLPVAFACLGLFDRERRTMKVVRAGVRGGRQDAFAADTFEAPFDDAALGRAAEGAFVCLRDVALGNFPWLRKLAAADLRSFAVTPLDGEGEVFGALTVGRTGAEGFSESECEFVKQLTEHVALAARHVQLYSALQQAYDKLHQTQQAVMQQERLRAVGQMASGIAHDINNALSPVALYTQSLLETEGNLSVRAREYLETTQRAIEDVAHTVGRLRDFYRQREQESPMVPVKLNELVDHAVSLTRARWSDMSVQRGIVVDARMELSPNVPAVLGVESEIREALVNLILNAVDALPNGGGLTVRTQVRSEGGGDQVRVEVCDTGAGMSEETRRRCLEPFYTTKGERGTGLGLAMVYGIVQRHGAKLEIESEPGLGTRVALVFPAASRCEPIAETKPAAAVSKGLRLLLVDDDPLVLESLKATLEIDGHTIVTALGGQKGIDIFKSAHGAGETFAAVITDLGMPHVDGRRVAASVKELSPTTPVVLLTGWGKGLAADGEAPQHVDALLGKPPRIRELRAALARVCQVNKESGNS